MKSLYLALVVCFAAGSASAQTVAITNAEDIRITALNGERATNPQWSPDGRFIAFSGDEYRGIYLYDIATGDVRALTEADGAGFGFSWAPDGSAILARLSRVEGVRRYHAAAVIDLTGEVQTLTEFRPQMPALPQWSPEGDYVVLQNRDEAEVFAVADRAPGAAAPSDEVLSLRVDRIVATEVRTGRTAEVDLFPGETLLNLVRSPDGSRIAFEVMGGNLFAANADGSGLVDLGPGNRPKFTPDGNRVVFMLAEDDGHTFTASDLYVVNADGSGRRNITSSERLEMNPHVSPDGRFIAYDEFNEGAIFIRPFNN